MTRKHFHSPHIRVTSSIWKMQFTGFTPVMYNFVNNTFFYIFYFRGETVELKRIAKYEQPNSDSEMESDSELSDSEVGQNAFFQRLRLRRGPSQEDDSANKGWFSWCTIV